MTIIVLCSDCFTIDTTFRCLLTHVIVDIHLLAVYATLFVFVHSNQSLYVLLDDLPS